MARRLANIRLLRAFDSGGARTLPHLHCVDVIRSNDRTRSKQSLPGLKSLPGAGSSLLTVRAQWRGGRSDLRVAGRFFRRTATARPQRTPACLSPDVRSESKAR